MTTPIRSIPGFYEVDVAWLSSELDATRNTMVFPIYSVEDYTVNAIEMTAENLEPLLYQAVAWQTTCGQIRVGTLSEVADNTLRLITAHPGVAMMSQDLVELSDIAWIAPLQFAGNEELLAARCTEAHLRVLQRMLKPKPAKKLRSFTV